MTETGRSRRPPRPLSELAEVYDLLEEVRLRPGMWVRRSSLQHLDSILTGYRVALEIHGVEEEFDFLHTGPFAEWLWKRLGMAYPSALGWAVEIERAAEAANVPAMELFFDLLDEFRAAHHGAQPSAEQAHKASPETEQPHSAE
ncbi:hypothetical protein [Streptomyces uncialis]|uniref:Uncharacterized protein n=1 Tax=Streptomyces uncialis TaxID=1048205 RepID=A0A1Q4VD22_9ACTN|nr:hypothetical protein [Streptomyces uncialis]OKH95754.1 hypothetical protein AB852_03100 [Streptomyces uncialis]